MFPMQTPTLRAKFILDKNKKPREKRPGHYEIILFLEDAPSGADEVSYKLHESYYNPLRVIPNTDHNPNFQEEITSYGDYIVTARVRRGSEVVKVRQSLSKALFESHGDSDDPDIQAALKEIRAN